MLSNIISSEKISGRRKNEKYCGIHTFPLAQRYFLKMLMQCKPYMSSFSAVLAPIICNSLRRPILLGHLTFCFGVVETMIS